MSKLSNHQKWQKNQGFFRNPLFYFGLTALFLWSVPFFGFEGLAKLNNLESSNTVVLNSFFLDTNNLNSDDLFFGQNNQPVKESPDLKIIQGSFVYGISTPRVLTTQTLGEILGESSSFERKEVQDHTVKEGETMASIAAEYGISTTTLALANNLSTNSALKVGQVLAVLPVEGLLYVVKPGDTISGLEKNFKSKSDDIVYYNNLTGEGIFIGDVLIIPYGKMPPKVIPPVQVALPESFFILPVEGRLTQGLHYYNGIDVANNCGTPIYAAASGVVQRVSFDRRYGQSIKILHDNNVATSYGHVDSKGVFVKSGDYVTVGDKIGLVGRTGTLATGCHVHFQVMGAKNPLAKYLLGTTLRFK